MDIYVRITVNKQRAKFSIKRDIAVCNWDIFRCRAANVITKRLNYLLEVLRAWEKISPIHRMHDHVKNLFDYAELEEKLERDKEEIRRMRNTQYLKPEKTVSKYEFSLAIEKLERERLQRLKLLKRFKLVKPSFCKQHYRIDMDVDEFERLKRNLKQEL